MALSDCIKCWNTPCDCGYEYECWSNDQFSKFINNILGKRSNEDIIRILNHIAVLRNIEFKIEK